MSPGTIVVIVIVGLFVVVGLCASALGVDRSLPCVTCKGLHQHFPGCPSKRT